MKQAVKPIVQKCKLNTYSIYTFDPILQKLIMCPWMQTTVHNAILVIKDVFSCNNAQPDKLYVIPALIELNKEQRIYSAKQYCELFYH